MNTYSNIRQISLEDFKNIDINRILYAQLDTGEILMINHKDKNKTNELNKKQKNKKIKKDYILSKNFYKDYIYVNKSKTVEKIYKRFNIIKGFKALSNFSFQKKLKFYDAIPKRAKYWENESFDSSKSNFQTNRLKSQRKYYNYNYINNYKPLSKDNEYMKDYDYYYNKYNYNDINYNNQANQYMDINYLYQLALGPLYSLYYHDKQIENYKNKEYHEKSNYSVEDIDYNYDYYQNQTNPYYYNDLQTKSNEEEK